MKLSLLNTGVMTSVMIAAATSYAAVYPTIDINFNGMPANIKPDTQTIPTDGSTLLKPTLVSEGTVNSVKTAKIYIRNGFDGSTSTDQVLVFENTVAGARSDLSFDCGPVTTVTTGTYKLGFDVLTTGATGATGPFWINLRGNPTASLGPIISSFGLYLSDAGAKVNNNAAAAMAKNTTHRIEYVIVLNGNAPGSASIYLDGQNVLSSTTIAANSIFRYVTMGMDATSQGTVIVDNVTLTAVPEPATASLVAFGFAAACMLPNRLHRAK